MNKYTPEQKAEVLQRARAIVDQHRREREQAADTMARDNVTDHQHEPDLHFTRPIESALDRWKREGTERMEREQAERERRDLEAIERRITQRVLANMQGLVAAEHEYLMNEFLPAYWNELHDEITGAIERSYELAFANVRSDLAALRTAVQKFTGTDAVIDLPALRVGKPLN